MPTTPTYPGVYIKELPSGGHEIAGVATSIAAFVGWAPQGDAGEAKLVESWKGYENNFGGLDPRSLLSYAVSHFFANGGQQAYVVRLTDPSDSASVLQPNTAAFESRLLATSGSGGIHLLKRVKLFNLLCVPGETTGTVIQSLQEFCHCRRAFLIIDCERDATFDSLRHGPVADITGSHSSNSALYFPWVEAPDPLQKGRLNRFAPCGFVAGIYARIDTARGVWKPPAGTHASLTGGSSPAIRLDDPETKTLGLQAVNCILKLPGSVSVLWGARTLRGNEDSGSDWKYVPVRRTALFLEESISQGTHWVVSEPNGEPTWAQIRSTVDRFMLRLFRAGAFAGSSPRDTYFVKCDGETTSQNDMENGITNILVGFALLRPAEFVIIKIQQIASSIQARKDPLKGGRHG